MLVSELHCSAKRKRMDPKNETTTTNRCFDVTHIVRMISRSLCLGFSTCIHWVTFVCSYFLRLLPRPPPPMRQAFHNPTTCPTKWRVYSGFKKKTSIHFTHVDLLVPGG